MKTMATGIVLGIVFSIALIFSNRAFASDTLPSCDYMVWKHGRYICADFDELDAQYAIVGCDKRRWLRELDRAPASKDGETGAAIFFHNMPLERD